ncbi:tryptophan synthase subunit alpha [Wukongibacter sp. M2B1]|uniref:tryptophan synthase subunit alpha n=1 Tax=Wukongibacter sp. M2B1 TaxID=3088895 RepID=UPI003D7A7DCD
MNNIRNIFNTKNKCITFYLTVGYPNEDEFFRALDILVKNGMDILELGIPVEKPHLDGRTIANTHHKVIEKGFNQSILVKFLVKIREKYPRLPLAIMSYLEGINKYNLLAKGEYYDAILCPDEYLVRGNNNTNIIQMYNEEMSGEEIKEQLLNNQGFAYVVTGAGTTGGKGDLHNGYLYTMKKIKGLSSIPIQIGFGIYSPQQVRTILDNGADGVIIGSEITRRIDQCNEEELRRYIQSIIKARG